MPYKDKNKQKEYQRTWVRQKRKGSTAEVAINVEPDFVIDKPEPQSYNPMMVGYVPPT